VLTLVVLAVTLSLAISAAQSFISQRVGSDHAVHVFLTRRIRKSGFRLFVRIPDILNDCYCAALPLYMHWVMAHFRTAAVFWSERLLNPVVNSLHVLLFAFIAAGACRVEGIPAGFAGAAACLFALTPQFYHALAARNFGLSARGTGLLLLTAFFATSWALEASYWPPAYWLALTILGWLIWGFSTFAQQALCILSALMLVLTGRYVPAVGAMLGLALFVALHPRYSIGYLRHTLLFIRTYAQSLAPIYILERRTSIWRDLIWDIWMRFASQGASKGLRYAYDNSVLVVLLLNPLAIVCLWAALRGAELHHGMLGFSLSLALCGVLAALLTSFRPTRFLGEPERYVEVIAPWAVLFGAHALFAAAPAFGLSGMRALMLLAALFLLLDIAQLTVSKILFNFVGQQAPTLGAIERAIGERWGETARVCCNNEHFTKMLMQHDWQYAYCLAVGQPYAGMTIGETFSSFPILRPEACRRIAERFRINACLLDRKEYEVLFDTPPVGLKSFEVAYESERFRLLFLEWESPDEPGTA
jgi:hypothetical protein